MQQRQDFVQKGGCRTGSDNRALRAKLTKMPNVPGVALRSGIFGLKADSARPIDSFHPVRAFPHSRDFWHQPCGYKSGAKLAGSEQLAQRPEDGPPRGAARHLIAAALARAQREHALEVARMRGPWD